MTQEEIKVWALKAGWTEMGGHLSLTKPRNPKEAIVRLVLKTTVASVEAKKPAGNKWEKIAGAPYAEITPDEDGLPRGLMLDTIPGFRTLMQENRDRKVFAGFGP